MLIWKLAARNVMRNRRRTLLTSLLIGSGLATMMLSDSFTTAMMRQMVSSVTDTFLGHAQVHANGYRQKPEVDNFVKESARLEGLLRNDPRIEAISSRVVAQGMLTSPRNVAAVTFYGIRSEEDQRLSKLKRAILEGDYLSAEPPVQDMEILIGERLARLLEVSVGDRVVLTAAQAEGGELSQELFRVRGVFRFGSRGMDQGMAFISLPKAQKVLKLPGQVHEIAIRFKDPQLAENPNLDLWGTLREPGNEALSWLRLNPAIGSMIELSSTSMAITGLILFALISVGIINSMFMSIYERMYEFGILKAIGTRARTLAGMILAESLVLGLVSCLMGLSMGAIATGAFAWVGVDFSGVDYGGARLNDPVRPVFSVWQFTGLPAYVVFLTALAAIYPAIYAARLVPSRAMRKSL